MGEWMTFPTAEKVLKVRVNRYWSGRRTNGTPFKCTNLTLDLHVHFDGNDVANLHDVAEAGLWECEIPISDDGF